jgi:hypothetical protein
MIKVRNWLLLTGLCSFLFVGLTFGLIGVSKIVAVMSFTCFYYSLIAIPAGVILHLSILLLDWAKKK